MGQFFGKYRGTVLNNIDPMQMGRLQASVPDVAIWMYCDVISVLRLS